MNNHKRRKLARVQEFENSLEEKLVEEVKQEIVEEKKVEEPVVTSIKKKKVATKEEVKTEE